MGRVQVICNFRNYNYWTGNAIGFRASRELFSNFLLLIAKVSCGQRFKFQYFDLLCNCQLCNISTLKRFRFNVGFRFYMDSCCRICFGFALGLILVLLYMCCTAQREIEVSVVRAWVVKEKWDILCGFLLLIVGEQAQLFADATYRDQWNNDPKPVQDIKERYLQKSRYLTVVGQSSVKTVA